LSCKGSFIVIIAHCLCCQNNLSSRVDIGPHAAALSGQTTTTTTTTTTKFSFSFHLPSRGRGAKDRASGVGSRDHGRPFTARAVSSAHRHERRATKTLAIVLGMA